MARRNKLERLVGLGQIATSKPPPPEKDPYVVRSALETITRADEIKKDRPLMKAVKTLARQQVKAVCK